MDTLSRSIRLIAVGMLALTFGNTLVIADPVSYQAGQAIEVREGDAWSAASVVRREGRKYLIHYAGTDVSSDEWVGTDRMRAGNAPGAGAPASVPPAPVPGASATPAPAPQTPGSPDEVPAPKQGHRARAKNGDMFPEPDEVIAQTEPNRANVDVEKSVDAPASWSVQTDTLAKPQPVRTLPLRTTSADQKMSVQQVLPCLGGGAVVGFSDFGDKNRRVERVGTSTGDLRATLTAQALPMAASPSGALLICRCNAFGFGNNARIDAYTLNSSQPAAVPLVSFKPYPSEDGSGKGEDVRFVAALSETRIITCDLKGRLIAWDIAANSVNGVWRVDVGPMHFDGECRNVALSPTGKWLAAAGKGGITFIDTASGKAIGVIPTAPDTTAFNLSCSPTGKTLTANIADGALVSFDVATGRQGRIVALPGNTFGPEDCVDDGYALYNGQMLIDTGTGAIVTHYQRTDGASLAVTGPGVTLLAGNAKLSFTHIPDDATRSAAEAAAETALALKPGMPVALDIQLDMSDEDRKAVEEAIRKQLTDDGFVIAPAADTTVTVRTEAGAQHEHVYSKSQMGMPVFMVVGSGTSIILTDKVTRLTIQHKGKTLWERKRTNGPANTFHLKDGQSLEDGAKESIKYDPQFLINLVIPPYIAEPQSEADKPMMRRPRRVRPGL